MKIKMEQLKELLFNVEEETVLAVLGNNYIEKFFATGMLGNGFSVLSDRRVYFKGDCFIRKGKSFYKKLEEKAVDLNDVTGTGFVRSNAIWALILHIVTLVQGGSFVLFTLCFALSIGVIDPMLLVFLGIAVFLILLSLFFRFWWKRNTYSVFEISYAGGGIAFDMNWITKEESEEFQRQLRLAKDHYKSTPAMIQMPVAAQNVKPADGVPEQLQKYKALLDQGILTQEEFDAKKRRLLNLD